MNDALIEELLNEDESATLDFKRDQYPFAGASDEEKSELLKDILAFANAWRRTTAYILIGVEEAKGSRGNVIGIANHLNDHDLQQFVNGKTSHPVLFAYHAYSFKGSQIGVIELPVQNRPVFLKKPYGKIPSGAVYLRRGSSTAIADPTEIASMGSADVAAQTPMPTFDVAWADLSSQQSLGPRASLTSTALFPKMRPESFRPQGGNITSMPLASFDGNYYRDLVDYVYDAAFLQRLGLVITNTSAIAAPNVLAKCRIRKIEGLRLHDFRTKPSRPSPLLPRAIPSIRRALRRDPDPLVKEFSTHWELTLEIGHMAPKAVVWSTDAIWLGAERSTSISFAIELFSDTLPSPANATLNVEIKSVARPMSAGDFPAGTFR